MTSQRLFDARAGQAGPGPAWLGDRVLAVTASASAKSGVHILHIEIGFTYFAYYAYFLYSLHIVVDTQE